MLDATARALPPAGPANDEPTATVEAFNTAPRAVDEDGKARAQATVLTEIGQAHHLFHDEGGDPYAAVPAATGTQVLAVDGSAYRELLGRDYYRLTGKGASRNSLTDAVTTLTAIAKHDGPCEAVWLRTGKTDTGICIDLGCGAYRAVDVTPEDWRVVAKAPVRLRRSGKPTPLPIPAKGRADIALLWRVLNVAEVDRPLVLGWLLGALRPTGPYPLLVLVGEQGSAKSTAARILKSLVDPSAVLLRAPVKDQCDLQVAARSSWVLALDNLSGVDASMSDALCRIATGGGFSARTLYTNSDETLIELQRPVILNGIDELGSRPDLAQRSIQVELPIIPDEERRTEREVWDEFEQLAPAIFAALLDALVLALRNLATTKLASKPRMADFALWCAAGLPALGIPADVFVAAYRDKQEQSVSDGLDSSALARALRRLIEREGEWNGSKAALLAQLNRERESDSHDGNTAGWPRSTKGLTNALRRLAPSLRQVGIDVTYDRTREARTVIVTYQRKLSGLHASQVSSVTESTLVRDAVTLVTDASPKVCVADPDVGAHHAVI